MPGRNYTLEKHSSRLQLLAAVAPNVGYPLVLTHTANPDNHWHQCAPSPGPDLSAFAQPVRASAHCLKNYPNTRSIAWRPTLLIVTLPQSSIWRSIGKGNSSYLRPYEDLEQIFNFVTLSVIALQAPITIRIILTFQMTALSYAKHCQA